MNIGIVCYPTFGGSGVLATELGKALADKGHNIHFITYQQPVRLVASMPIYFTMKYGCPPIPCLITRPMKRPWPVRWWM